MFRSFLSKFEFSRVNLQEKNIPIDFLFDELDIDLYLFDNFLDV